VISQQTNWPDFFSFSLSLQKTMKIKIQKGNFIS
jgi:hypothetical protein